MEVKSHVTDKRLSSVTHLARVQPYIGVSNDEIIRFVVPWEHMMQMVHQCYVMNLTVALYVCASETGILYTAIMCMDEYVLELVREVLEPACGQYVTWAHTPNWVVSNGYSEWERRFILSPRSYWFP